MTTTGLSPRTAGALCYLGWWVTGLIFLGLERRDRFVRFHAAQATAAFGLLAVVIALFGALALISLSFATAGFDIFLAAAGVTWVVSAVLGLVAMVLAARGSRFRLPVAAQWADRLVDR
jgi:uncharacterized membrane protein